MENFHQKNLATSRHPLEIDLVLINLAKYLDWNSLKSGREVCSSWLEILTPSFQNRSQVHFSSRKTNEEFYKRFPPSSDTKLRKLHLSYDKSFNGITDGHDLLARTSKWLNSHGHILTNLTLGSEEKAEAKNVPILLILESLTMKTLFQEWCPNIKYLTLINAESQTGDSGSCLLDVVPNLNLSRLLFKFTGEVKRTWEWAIGPFTLAERVLKLTSSVNKLCFQFNEEPVQYYVSESQFKIFSLIQNVSELSIENKIQYCQKNYKMQIRGSTFPNLKRLSIPNKGLSVTRFSRNIRFPELEQLNVYIDEDSYQILKEAPKLRKLTINYWTSVYFLTPELFSRRCPNLTVIELEEISNKPYVMELKIIAHPNVQELKVSLKEINYEGIFQCFPNLKILKVDLTDRDLFKVLHVLTSRPTPTLKQLTILENSSKEHFETAMDMYFNKLLLGVQKLKIKTLNSHEIRGPNLLNSIFDDTREMVQWYNGCALKSLTLQGYKICSKQYESVKHNVPFHLLIL